MRFLLSLITLLSFNAVAQEGTCAMDRSQEARIASLFSKKEHLYSLLWWTDPESKVLNARTFVVNGHDSAPVFSSESEGKRQVAGSGYEKDLVGIDPGLLATILQKIEYAILDPGGSDPIQFKTCVLKPYAKLPGA